MFALALIALAISIGAFVACEVTEDNRTVTVGQTPQGIALFEVLQGSTSLTEGANQIADGTVLTVRWRAEATHTATVTIGGAAPVGTTVGADGTSTALHTVSANVTISITATPTGNQPAPTISIAGEATRTARVGDEAVTLAATVQNLETYQITWSTSDPLVATVSNGVVTFVGQGDAAITATIDGVTPAVSASVNFVVSPVLAPAPTISIAGDANREARVGDPTVTLTPTVTNLSTYEITWSTSDPLVATVLNGVITFVGQGNVTITATIDGVIPAVSASVNFVVSPALVPSIEITGHAGGNVRVTDSPVQLNAVVTNLSTYEVIWTTNLPQLATVDRYTGLVSFEGHLGTVRITATEETGISTFIEFTIFDVPTGINLPLGSAITTREDDEINLSSLAAILPLIHVHPDYALAFSASGVGTNVARINQTEGFVYFSGHGNGSVTVTIPGTSFSETILFAVDAVPTTITLRDIQTTVRIDHSPAIQLLADVNTNASGFSLRWHSNAPSVASINTLNGVVTLHTPGTVTFTVFLYDGATQVAGEHIDTDTVVFTITAVPTGVTIMESTTNLPFIASGEHFLTNFLTNLGRDPLHIRQDDVFYIFPRINPYPAASQNYAIEWETTGVIQFNETTGRLSFSGPGAGTLIARLTITTATGSSTVQATLSGGLFNNIRPVATGINVIGNRNATVGDSPVQLTASIVPTNTVGYTINWHSSNENAVTVNNNGLVTIVDEGSSTITVSLVGFGTTVSYQFTFVVNPIGVYSITFNLNSGNWPDGTTVPFQGEYDTAVQIPTAVPTRVGHSFGGWQLSSNTSVIYQAGDMTTTTIPEGGITFNAIWNVNQYSITFNSDGGSAVSNISNQNYGTSLATLWPSNPTKTGYTFRHWASVGTTTAITVPTNMPAGGLNLTAIWEINTYTITFNLNDGTNHAENPSTFNIHDLNITLENASKEHHSFDGWFAHATEGSTPITQITTLGDVTLFARWTLNQFTVTFDTASLHDSTHTNETVFTINSSSFALTAPTNRTGHTFNGWWTTAEVNGERWEDIPTALRGTSGTQTLFARWTANTYNLTFNLNGGSFAYGITPPENGLFNSTVNFPTAPTRNGFTFAGWQVVGSEPLHTYAPNAAVSITTIPVNGLTFIAQWTARTDIEVTFNPESGTLDVPSEATRNVSFNAQYGTLPVVNRNGYTFVGWWTTPQGVEGGVEITAATYVTNYNNHTLHARWSLITSTVSFNLNGGINHEDNPATFTVYDLPIVLANPTRNGYRFEGWYTEYYEGVFSNPITEITTLGNVTLFARWTAINIEIDHPLTLTVRADNGNIDLGALISFYIDGTPTSLTPNLSWTQSVSTQNIAFVNEYGVVSFAPGSSGGTFAAIAQIQGTNRSVSITFTVRPMPTGITINGESGNYLTPTQLRQDARPLLSSFVTAIAPAASYQGYALTWTYGGVARIAGNYVEFTGHGEGWIRVALVDFPTIYAYHHFNVSAVPTGVEIRLPENTRIPVLEQSNLALYVLVFPHHELTTVATGYTLVWSATGEATVTNNGFVNFLNPGEAEITVRLYDGATFIAENVAGFTVVQAFLIEFNTTYGEDAFGWFEATRPFNDQDSDLYINLPNFDTLENPYFVFLGWRVILDIDGNVPIDPPTLLANSRFEFDAIAGQRIVLEAVWTLRFRVNYVTNRGNWTIADSFVEVGHDIILAPNPTDAQDNDNNRRFAGFGWTGLDTPLNGGTAVNSSTHNMTAGDTFYIVARWWEPEIERNGAVLTWQNNVNATSFNVVYDFISYDAHAQSENAREHNNIEATSLTLSTGGFVTNLRIAANLEGRSTRQSDFQTELSYHNGIYMNETFHVSETRTLQEALIRLTTENPGTNTGGGEADHAGAARNEIMALLVDTAIGQVRNHAAVHITSVGTSFVVASPVHMNLNVGGETRINFNEDGSIYEAYKLILSNANATGLGSGDAQGAAILRDRAYFNAETNIVYNHRLWNEIVIPVINMQARDHLHRQTLEEFVAQHNVTPYAFFGYIVRPSYMVTANSGGMGNSNDTTFLQIETVNRQRIQHNANANTFTFTAIMNQNAGYINRHEVIRSGGLGPGTNYRPGNYITLAFTICSLTLDIVSYTTTTRYNAPHIVTGDTRVRTTASFEFFNPDLEEGEDFKDAHLTMPWTGGDRNPAMPANKPNPPSAAAPGGGCFVEGTLITLYDGSQKAVEYLEAGDMVKVWNFYEGRFDFAPILYIENNQRREREIISLNFSNDVNIQFAYEHGFFNLTRNQFVDINCQNALNYVGDYFKYYIRDGDDLSWKPVRLDSVDFFLREVAVFAPVTAFHFSVYANRILTVGSGNGFFINVFNVIEDDLIYCSLYRNLMIAKHGLLSFEEFDLIVGGSVPELFFDMHRGQYLAISIAKGLTTWEDFLLRLEAFAHLLP